VLQYGVQSPDPRLQLRHGVLDSEFVAAANAHAAKPQHDQHDADGPFDAVIQVPRKMLGRLPMFGSRFCFCGFDFMAIVGAIHFDAGRTRTLKFVFTAGVGRME
jgi:hypothetical protein